MTQEISQFIVNLLSPKHKHNRIGYVLSIPMSEFYTRNLIRSLPITIGMVLLAIMISYFLIPTNVGYTFWALLLVTGVCYYVFSSTDSGPRLTVALFVGGISVILIASMFFSPLVFTRIDNAKYFDQKLTYMGENDLPFNHRINGSELRVVDEDLARSIMDKTNPFGSDKAISSIHLGNYHSRIYWIGAAIFDGLKFSSDNNRVIGFILVDITDPTIEPIILHIAFNIDPNLIFNRDLGRAVWFENINYQISDNSYFSYNDKLERMEYIVPYSIRDSSFLGDSHGGFVTSDMQLDGGVLIFNSDGHLIHDYSSSEREQLPSHARIQVYAETWLEAQIKWWGKSLYADHDVRWSTSLPWIKSTRKLGVDDDVRVVINPDDFNTVQYILLDSTDSSNQILRGAIKANVSGLFYYNFEKYQFIDTNSAHDFVEATITNIRQTSTHGYQALLPILYPVRENVTSLYDYAYVMPLQLGNQRFGGIAVINPADKTGTQSVVQFVESQEKANVSATVAVAIEKYLALVDSTDSSTPTGEVGNFTISDIRSFQQNGNTVYAMLGNFSLTEDQIRVIFTQNLITNDLKWLAVVFANVGDTLQISLEINNGVYYATDVII